MRGVMVPSRYFVKDRKAMKDSFSQIANTKKYKLHWALIYEVLWVSLLMFGNPFNSGFLRSGDS